MIIAKDSKGKHIKLPSIAKVSSLMRNNKWVKRQYGITSAFVVGSVAKGTATDESDIDIAIIIPRVKGKTSVRVSEDYHSRFTRNFQMPHFAGRRLDFQFYYEDDKSLEGYSKIELN